MIKEIVEPNFDLDRIKRCHGFKNAISILSEKYDCDFLSGHFAYGIHLFTKRKVDYINFFRDPIDRCVSFYYFVQKGKDNPNTRHPLCSYAESVSLKEFYQNKKFHNLQTRYTAGIFWHKCYILLNSINLEEIILNKALHNLNNNYVYFGILEEREKSLAMSQERFGWKCRIKVTPQQKTFNRARVEDLDKKTIDVLKQANNLDIRLYDYVRKTFNNYAKRL